MTFESQFADFIPTNAETFQKNLPNEKEYTDKKTFLKHGYVMFAAQSGKANHIRLIPWPGFGYFARKASVHYGIGVEKNAYACLKMLGEDKNCPICKASRVAYAAANKEKGKELSANQRHLLIIVDRNQTVKGPQVLVWSETAVTDLRSRIDDPITKAPRAIDAIQNGFDVMFTKRKQNPGAKFETTEDLFVANTPTPLSSDMNEMTNWLNYCRDKFTDYNSMFEFKTEAELEAIVEGAASNLPGLDANLGGQDPFANFNTQQTPPPNQQVRTQPTVEQLFGNIQQPVAQQVPQAQQVQVPPAQQTEVPPIPAQFQVQVPPATATTAVPEAPSAQLIPAVVPQTTATSGAQDSEAIRASIKAKLEAQKAAQG